MLVREARWCPGADDTSRERLRETFTEVAELYDRSRPRYPSQMFEDLADLSGAGAGCRVLEIGCGTGQAAVPLAERGYRIVIFILLILR